MELVGDVSGARMLDIGVGGGRTTAYFLDRVGSYVGVDYSPELVEACRERFPGADVSLGDARHLARFPDGSFDFVLFSFNGIDYVSQHGRHQVLAEVRRVLATGGTWMFSTHNRDYERLGRLPWQDARPGRTMLRQSARAVRHTRRRRAMRQREVVGPDHVLHQRRRPRLVAADLLHLRPRPARAAARCRFRRGGGLRPVGTAEHGGQSIGAGGTTSLAEAVATPPSARRPGRRPGARRDPRGGAPRPWRR